MPDVMIDIETLSTHPHNAVVLSVAAVSFELHRAAPQIFDSRLCVLDIHEQIAEGREISYDAMKFWREQSPKARAHWGHSDHGQAQRIGYARYPCSVHWRREHSGLGTRSLLRHRQLDIALRRGSAVAIQQRS